jgi:LysM repeat protein
MERILFVFFMLSLVSVASPTPAAAANQFWKVRSGDTLETIATTLDIPNEDIKKLNPGVSESNLQIGQQLKLPLRSYPESKRLEDQLGKTAAQVGRLEQQRSDLAIRIAGAEAQLLWHPVWFWGFWLCFAVIAFIAGGAYWIFRQTHPRVFAQPGERTIRDLQVSQTRVRSTFPHDEEETFGSHSGHWHPLLKRVTHTG